MHPGSRQPARGRREHGGTRGLSVCCRSRERPEHVGASFAGQLCLRNYSGGVALVGAQSSLREGDGCPQPCSASARAPAAARGRGGCIQPRQGQSVCRAAGGSEVGTALQHLGTPAQDTGTRGLLWPLGGVAALQLAQSNLCLWTEFSLPPGPRAAGVGSG